MDGRLTRRDFLRTGSGALASALLGAPAAQTNWRALLDDYETSTRGNIVTVNGRRALLSSRLYPGTYVRDAVFWGPLGLEDPALGYECFGWFADTQLDNGQIRTAVPLLPGDEMHLTPQDDEGTLLFIIAAGWLAGHGYKVDLDQLASAYAWVQTHVDDDTYISAAGPFRYWADTVSPDTDEAISHNQGLLCLARRALVALGLPAVREADVARAQARYRGFWDASAGYLPLGRSSNFGDAQDISALLPEFISRYVFDEAILDDAVVVGHVEHMLATTTVTYADGRVAGMKVIAGPFGEFLPAAWYFAPGLNAPGDYQNGGYWPMYTLVALALAYRITRDARYATLVGQLVRNELAADHQSKEVIRLMPGAVGTHDPERANYTWNVLIRAACRWSGLA